MKRKINNETNSNYNGKINGTDLAELFDVLIIYFLRRRMIYGLTSAENKSLPALSRAIGKIENSDNKRETMFDILASQENMQRLPNDVELSRVLETMNFYNYRLCKFMLAKVEEKLKTIHGFHISEIMLKKYILN